MPNKKISALTALTGANSAVDDLYVVVDTDATETKKQTRAELFKSIPAADFADTFVFNEAGADKDARFGSDTDPNLLFTDASADRVSVGCQHTHRQVSGERLVCRAAARHRHQFLHRGE